MGWPADASSMPELGLESRVLALEAGMYIIRYASEFPEGQEVLITLQQAPVGRGTLDLFPADGVIRNTLSKLGDCVVVRVRGGAAGLLVTEYHLALPVRRRVDLRLDRIDTSAAIQTKAANARPSILAEPPDMGPRGASPPPARPPVPAAAVPVALELEGHVERLGDVKATEGWLGNPGGTARLEGFCVRWPAKPEGVDLAYSCRVGGADTQPAALSGEFIGTRRRAAGITAVTLGLVGPRQKRFHLSGQVVFCGCPPQEVLNGREMRGPTGQEHLVALIASVAPKLAASPLREPSPWDDPAITRLHRAKG